MEIKDLVVKKFQTLELLKKKISIIEECIRLQPSLQPKMNYSIGPIFLEPELLRSKTLQMMTRNTLLRHLEELEYLDAEIKSSVIELVQLKAVLLSQ